jgi:hypothetical protein
MVKAADKDGDGTISFDEFLEAFHSPQWREARALGISQSQFRVFSQQQDAMYEKQLHDESLVAHEEGDEHLIEGKAAKKEALMKRRALRRHPFVKEKIDAFWNALNALKVAEVFVPKGLYLTYHLKIMSVLDPLRFDADGDGQIDEEEDKLRMQEADEDWEADCRRARLQDVDETGDGDNRIGYGVFYDSLFELADCEYGRDRTDFIAAIDGKA